MSYATELERILAERPDNQDQLFMCYALQDHAANDSDYGHDETDETDETDEYTARWFDLWILLLSVFATGGFLYAIKPWLLAFAERVAS